MTVVDKKNGWVYYDEDGLGDCIQPRMALDDGESETIYEYRPDGSARLVARYTKELAEIARGAGPQEP